MFHDKTMIDMKVKHEPCSQHESTSAGLMEELIAQFQSELLHLAMSYLKDYQLAQDCVQEVFVTAFHKADPGRDRAAMRKWLKICTINRCKSMLRSAFWRKLVFMEHDRMTGVSASGVEAYSSLDDTGVLEHVMKLTVKYREVIVLHYYQDMPLQEVSVVLGVSHEAVKSRLRRAKNQLRAMLNGGGINE